MRSDNIVPELCVHDAGAAIAFYQRAFGAVEIKRMHGPDGKKVLHAELQIGGHRLIVFDEFSAAEGGTLETPRSLSGTSVRLILQVADAAKTVETAAYAGATVMMPVTQMFWGARYGKLKDPYGHEWGINEQHEDLTPAEEKARAKAHFESR